MTVLVDVVFPPPQLNVAPAVLDEAVKVSLMLVHVSSIGEEILTFGAIIFWVTVVEAEPVHPLDGSVAVTL